MNKCLSLLPYLDYHNFLDHPFIDFEQFNDMCRKVYFATEDYSLSTFALVNGGLFYLFREITSVQGKDVPEAAENVALCRANLEYAISHFNIFMAPTKENLQALLLGVCSLQLLKVLLFWLIRASIGIICNRYISAFSMLGTHVDRSPRLPDPRLSQIRGLPWR